MQEKIDHTFGNSSRRLRRLRGGSILAYGRDKKLEMSLLPNAIEQLIRNATLGKTEVAFWHIDQDFTEIRVEFPEAADEYSAVYGLPDRIVPGLRLCSSDTAKSSVVIEPIYRINSGIAIGEDSVRQVHKGDITEKEILGDVDTRILTKLKGFPEALIDRLGVAIGDQDLSTAEGRRENASLVYKCLKAGIHALGINTTIGKARKKLLLERLKAEINPAIRYTEYDIAMILMGLADRVHLNSRELSIRLAKNCGKAAAIPYLDLALKNQEDEDDIFIDKADVF